MMDRIDVGYGYGRVGFVIVQDQDNTIVGAIFGASAEDVAVAQERSNWCWAASTQMLRRHVGLTDRSQCEIASTRFALKCCEDPASCNRALPLDQITALLAENLLSSRRHRGQLSDEEIWRDLFAKRPVLIVDVFDNGVDGHARILLGWQSTSRKGNLVRVLDPAEAKRSATTIEELRRSRWAHTWHSIEAVHVSR